MSNARIRAFVCHIRGVAALSSEKIVDRQLTDLQNSAKLVAHASTQELFRGVEDLAAMLEFLPFAQVCS